MVDIIVIGAGTAGLSAAIYGVRAGKDVLVLENQSYGGQIINAAEVENYPGIKNISGFQFATDIYEQAVSLGAEITFEEVIDVELEKDVKIVKTKKNIYECKAVIIATGAGKRKLGLENEEKLVGRGISYCATCDGMFFKGKDVAVVGGGNTAISDALFLSEYCNKVYVIHRRDKFRGEESRVKALQDKENVELVLDSKVTGIIGEHKVESIEISNVIDNTLVKYVVDGVFVAVGQQPNTSIYKDIIDTDNAGYIMAGENCKTNINGVYVAGDVRSKEVRQLTTAASDGAVAALAAVSEMA